MPEGIPLVANLLLLVGYPLAIAVLVRWVPVVRQRRLPWLAAHHAGVAAIVAGWAVRGRWPAAAVNAAWLVGSTAWFVLGGQREQRA